MIVSCEGAPLHEFDLEGADELWLKEKHRRILDVDRTDWIKYREQKCVLHHF